MVDFSFLNEIVFSDIIICCFLIQNLLICILSMHKVLRYLIEK